jgi:hypothetical protein
MELNQRARELLLMENDLETITLEFCPARAPVAEPLTLCNQPLKRAGELLNLHPGSLALRRRFGHVASLYLRARLSLISPVKAAGFAVADATLLEPELTIAYAPTATAMAAVPAAMDLMSGVGREWQFLRIRDDVDHAFSELAACRLDHSRREVGKCERPGRVDSLAVGSPEGPRPATSVG